MKPEPGDYVEALDGSVWRVRQNIVVNGDETVLCQCRGREWIVFDVNDVRLCPDVWLDKLMRYAREDR